MGLSLCPLVKNSPLGTRTSQSTEPKFVSVRSTNSSSVLLGVMVIGNAPTCIAWFPDTCILLEDKTSDVSDLDCTLSLEDGAVLEEDPCRVSFPNLCPSYIFKRPSYCDSELVVASLWYCIGKNQEIPWSYSHCHTSFNVIIKFIQYYVSVSKTLYKSSEGPDKALLA